MTIPRQGGVAVILSATNPGMALQPEAASLWIWGIQDQ
jgi:hypothetical protein